MVTDDCRSNDVFISHVSFCFLRTFPADEHPVHKGLDPEQIDDDLACILEDEEATAEEPWSREEPAILQAGPGGMPFPLWDVHWGIPPSMSAQLPPPTQASPPRCPSVAAVSTRCTGGAGGASASGSSKRRRDVDDDSGGGGVGDGAGGGASSELGGGGGKRARSVPGASSSVGVGCPAGYSSVGSGGQGEDGGDGPSGGRGSHKRGRRDDGGDGDGDGSGSSAEVSGASGSSGKRTRTSCEEQ